MVSAVDRAVDVPGYTVGARLGSGGFGEVFGARHDKMGREVAIKILHAKYSADAEAVARFTAEARAIAAISHPGIVDIFDFGELADGRQFCVMERIHGETLRDVLRARTRIPLDEALPILRAIADAVDAAHAVGIAHRDLKPDNVFVLPDGTIKLIDFGLAKITRETEPSVTQTGSVFGTPMYMSPEQCRGKAIDTRTDLYSFGVLAYHVLVGEPPFSGDALELALHHLNDEPGAPSTRHAELPVRVDRALLALLAKDPQDRPAPLVASVEIMEGIRAAPRRKRTWVIALAVLLIGAGATTWIASRGSRRTEPSITMTRVAMPAQYERSTKNLTPDGASILLSDDDATWSLDLATRKMTKLPAGSSDVLPDGRLLVVHGAVEPDSGSWPMLTILDPKTGIKTELGEGVNSSVSPDGRYIATYAKTGLVLIEIETRQRRILHGTSSGANIPRWSPDSTRMLVMDSASYTLAIQDVSGARRMLDLQMPRADRLHPAAFIGPRRIVYCRAESERTLVQTRDLDDDAEVQIADLGPSINHCSFSVAAAGRVVLTARRAIGGLVHLALDGTDGITFESDLGNLNPIVIGADERTLYARGPKHSRIDPESPVKFFELVPGQSPVPLRCEGVHSVVRRGSRDLVVTIATGSADDSVELRERATCDVVDRWSIPHLEDPSSPVRCSATWCVIARGSDSRLSVYRLDPGAARGVEISATTHLAVMALPAVAIAPDARRIVALYGPSSRPVLIDVEHSTHEVPIEAQGLAWGNDPNQFFLTGSSGTQFQVTSVGVDGTSKLVWKSTETWIVDLLFYPRSDRNVAFGLTLTNETYVVKLR